MCSGVTENPLSLTYEVLTIAFAINLSSLIELSFVHDGGREGGGAQKRTVRSGEGIVGLVSILIRTNDVLFSIRITNFDGGCR